MLVYNLIRPCHAILLTSTDWTTRWGLVLSIWLIIGGQNSVLSRPQQIKFSDLLANETLPLTRVNTRPTLSESYKTCLNPLFLNSHKHPPFLQKPSQTVAIEGQNGKLENLLSISPPTKNNERVQLHDMLSVKAPLLRAKHVSLYLTILTRPRSQSKGHNDITAKTKPKTKNPLKFESKKTVPRWRETAL